MRDLYIIKKAVESYFETDITEKNRKKTVSIPRFYFYYLARKHTRRTCDKIAEYCNQDHASVTHGEKKINSEKTIYKDVRDNILNIEEKMNLRALKFETCKDEIQYCKKQNKRFKLRKKELKKLIDAN
jgi:hypothetical protein